MKPITSRSKVCKSSKKNERLLPTQPASARRADVTRFVSYIRLSATRNNSAADVTGGKPGTVAILDLQGKAPVRKISCGCKLTGLDRLDGDNLFRLTEPSNRPMWVLEANAKETRVVFVPAALARSSAK